MNYGFLIDNSACIGCHACSTACKSENQVPLGVSRTWVKYTETGHYPDVRRAFQVTRCNHCANPPCVRICPTAAMFQRDDGIVEFDSDACIGCAACTQACPYDAIYIDPDTQTAAKCHYCSHRIDVGIEPACVVVCPEHAIISGDLDDPESEISRKLAKNNVTVRKPDQGTAPKLFYIEGNDIALHPTALPREPSGMMFADVIPLHPGHPVGTPHGVTDHDHGAPGGGQSGPESRRAPQPQGAAEFGPLNVGGRMAEHMVQVGYNAQHKVQWHWQIPAYIVTKHLAGGAFVFLALMALLPDAWLPFDPFSMVTVGAFAIVMTLMTLFLLIIDLRRPDRFFFLLIRPQWRSWVARAAWILSGFSATSGLWWAVETGAWLVGIDVPFPLRAAMAIITIPFALMAALYTAFLFAQAEGRDLWQSTHVPVQMFFHMVVFGAAVFAISGPTAEFARVVVMLGIVGSGLTTLAADVWFPHSSELARRAARMMVWGSYRQHFWWGGIALAHVIPLVFTIFGAVYGGMPGIFAGFISVIVLALGHYFYNVAFVTAPQELPNS